MSDSRHLNGLGAAGVSDVETYAALMRETGEAAWKSYHALDEHGAFPTSLARSLMDTVRATYQYHDIPVCTCLGYPHASYCAVWREKESGSEPTRRRPR